jgi:serine/threonine-protein kinase RsbW
VQRLEARADPDCLERMHLALDALWEEAPHVPGGVRLRFATALAEVVANVVEHGRCPEGGPPLLRLALEAVDGAVVGEVTDDAPLRAPEGGAMPGEDAEGGRGLAMANALLDELEHAHDGQGNRWRLVLRLGSGA